MMKVVETIKKIILTILGVAFFAFALCMTILLLYFNKYGVTQFGNTSLIIINEEITSEKYVKGDLVTVDKPLFEKIEVGDEIFAYSVDKNHIPHVNVGIVGEKYDKEADNLAISFENGDTFSDEYIIGKATNVRHKIGTFLSIIESQWGFLFIILVPGFLIFIYEIYALIVEIKYGEEEEN